MNREMDRVRQGKVIDWGEGPRSLYELAHNAVYKARWFESYGDLEHLMNPWLIEECMRDIAEERGEDMPKLPILYGGSYCGIVFSDSFLAFIGYDSCQQDETWRDSRARKQELRKKGRHAYDSVVAFGNLIMHRAPNMVADFLKIRREVREAWDKKVSIEASEELEPHPKRQRSASLEDARLARRSYYAWTEKEREFRDAQKNDIKRKETQSILTSIIQQEPDLSQWYCARPVTKEIEEAGLYLASGACRSLEVEWVPSMVPYRIEGGFESSESVEW